MGPGGHSVTQLQPQADSAARPIRHLPRRHVCPRGHLVTPLHPRAEAAACPPGHPALRTRWPRVSLSHAETGSDIVAQGRYPERGDRRLLSHSRPQLRARCAGTGRPQRPGPPSPTLTSCGAPKASHLRLRASVHAVLPIPRRGSTRCLPNHNDRGVTASRQVQCFTDPAASSFRPRGTANQSTSGTPQRAGSRRNQPRGRNHWRLLA